MQSSDQVFCVLVLVFDHFPFMFKWAVVSDPKRTVIQSVLWCTCYCTSKWLCSSNEWMNEFSVEYIAVCRHHAVALSQAISHVAAAAAAAAVTAGLQSNSWLLISLRLRPWLCFQPTRADIGQLAYTAEPQGQGGTCPLTFSSEGAHNLVCPSLFHA